MMPTPKPLGEKQTTISPPPGDIAFAAGENMHQKGDDRMGMALERLPLVDLSLDEDEGKKASPPGKTTPQGNKKRRGNSKP